MINISKINFLFLLGIILVFFSCNNDEEIVYSSPISKTPKYNNGIFFTTSNGGFSRIDTKINFLNLKDNSINEIYSSTTNNIVSIDGDKTYYYLSNRKLENNGNNSIIVKDVETFNNVTTITSNINYPKKVVSYNNKLFILNDDDSNSFDVKPFISIFTKNKDFTFEKRIDLPVGRRIEKIAVFGNKLHLILVPTQSTLSQSIVVFDLQNEQIESNITRIASHNTPAITSMGSFENEVYFSVLSTVFGFLSTITEVEVHKLSGSTVNLSYKINNSGVVRSNALSSMASYKSDFYITFDKFIYKRITSNTDFNLVYTNDDSISFLHFLNSTEFLVLDRTKKLIMKDLNDKSVSKELKDFTFGSRIHAIKFFKL